MKNDVCKSIIKHIKQQFIRFENGFIRFEKKKTWEDSIFEYLIFYSLNFFVMEKFNFIWLLGVILGLTLFSCNDDDGDGNGSGGNVLSRNYFSVDDAKFVNAQIPDGSANLISNLSVNNTAITGGSSIVSFSSSEELKAVYVGVEGEKGYYEYELTSTRSTAALYQYQFVLLISQNISVSGFIVRISAITANGTVASVNSSAVAITEVGTGALQVSLSWDQLDDVDLHLFEPDGTEIYYGNLSSVKYENDEMVVYGILDLDSNPGCSIDGINNENITYEKNVKHGTYTVAVDLYEKCASSTAGAKYSVTAIYNGHHIPLDKPTGQFAGDDSGSYNTPSRYVIIGAFTIGAGGMRSSEANTVNPFVLQKEKNFPRKDKR